MEDWLASLFSLRWGWLTIWALCVVALLLFFLVMTVAGVHPWSDVTKDRVAWYHQEECEQVTTSGFFLQFHNFWSNLAFLAAGLLILWFSTAYMARAIGIVFILLAAGSGWFHGTLGEVSQTVDIMTTYSALTVLIAYAFIELVPLEQDGVAAWLLFSAAVVLGAVAGILRTTVHFFDSDYFTPFLVIILVIYMGVLISRCTDGSALLWPGIFTAVFGLLAVVFKFTDGDKNLFANHGGVYSKCSYAPSGLWQGHALWHLLSAAMFVCMFEYIRSVRNRSRSVWPWRISD